MIQQLLNRARTVEVQILAKGNRFVLDSDLLKDLSPYVYNKLDAKIGTLNKHDFRLDEAFNINGAKPSKDEKSQIKKLFFNFESTFPTRKKNR